MEIKKNQSGIKAVLRKNGILANNIAIDLGTANILIYAQGKGIVVNEPSVIALMQNSNGSYTPYAYGKDAKNMLGRTPSGIIAMRPLKDGVIADFTSAESMIRYFINKINKNTFFNKPTVIICVPSGSTPVERRAIQEAAESCNVKTAYLIEEPMAAAIGANLPVTNATGSMIVDIGGGTTEVAILSLGGIVYAGSIRVGGDIMDDAIIAYIRKEHNLLIGESTAEKIKKTIGSAVIMSDRKQKNDASSIVIKGRDMLNGIPKEISVTDVEISTALQDPVNRIIDAIKTALESAPPELSADISDHGIMISGGGSLLRNLDVMISQATGIKVNKADDPLCSVALGIGNILDNMPIFKHMLFRQD